MKEKGVKIDTANCPRDWHEQEDLKTSAIRWIQLTWASNDCSRNPVVFVRRSEIGEDGAIKMIEYPMNPKALPRAGPNFPGYDPNYSVGKLKSVVQQNCIAEAVAAFARDKAAC